MTVLCPCASKCNGSDSFGRAPECFLSQTSKITPIQFMDQMDMGWGGILGRAFLRAAANLMHEVYQCPSCGCEVLFVTWETSSGKNRKRVTTRTEC